MIAPLTNDPAWVRYEWELRHLALINGMQEIAEAWAEIAKPMAEAMTTLAGTLATYARSDSYRNLVAAMRMGQP